MASAKTLSLILVSLVSCVWATAHAKYVIHEKREDPVRAGVMRNRVHPNTLLPMRIALRQNKQATSNAEAWLKAVSDPDSAKKLLRHSNRQTIPSTLLIIGCRKKALNTSLIATISNGSHSICPRGKQKRCSRPGISRACWTMAESRFRATITCYQWSFKRMWIL